MVPAGLIWKLNELRTSGWRQWALEALKMGTEWGQFSALYAGGEKFVAGVRAHDDKLNSYVACGICSATSRAKEGLPAMAQGFVTGFAFVYVLELLGEILSENGNGPHGKEAIEGVVGQTVRARGASSMVGSRPVPSALRKYTSSSLPKKRF
jgi:hypothetical protein